MNKIEYTVEQKKNFDFYVKFFLKSIIHVYLS